ncbi:hypothetical protein CFP56_006108 [Quercus suber]|uniref:Uncharacterized protein n=1 Tax=Quercus suber TaxID=58331 RepID=A0AAW0LAC2_QUESU
MEGEYVMKELVKFGVPPDIAICKKAKTQLQPITHSLLSPPPAGQPKSSCLHRQPTSNPILSPPPANHLNLPLSPLPAHPLSAASPFDCSLITLIPSRTEEDFLAFVYKLPNLV